MEGSRRSCPLSVWADRPSQSTSAHEADEKTRAYRLDLFCREPDRLVLAELSEVHLFGHTQAGLVKPERRRKSELSAEVKHAREEGKIRTHSSASQRISSSSRRVGLSGILRSDKSGTSVSGEMSAPLSLERRGYALHQPAHLQQEMIQ